MRSKQILVCCIALVACSGTRSETTNRLGSEGRDPAEADGSAAESNADDEDGESMDAGSSALGPADEDEAFDAAEPDAEGAVDAAREDPERPDQPPADAAQSSPDGAAAQVDAGALPPELYVFDANAAGGEIAPEVSNQAAAPVSAGELSEASARAFEEVSAVSATEALPKAETGAGLTVPLLITWGYLPGMQPPAQLAWRDLSGYLAVGGGGTIEVVRAVRRSGATEPQGPRPSAGGVAPQTDPRLVRFTSFIGSGYDGLVVRLHRPAIQPVAVALSVAGTVQTRAFEAFLGTGSQTGGWSIPYGQVGFEYVRPPTSRCYVDTGTVAGSVAYQASPATGIMSFSGAVMRPGGAQVPLTLSANTSLFGPYGSLGGSFAGLDVSAFFGRSWTFSNYVREGIVIGQLSPAGEPPELFIAYYEGIKVLGSQVFRASPCDAPGARRQSPL